MTRTPPKDPAGLSDFIPERDGHALVLGPGARTAVGEWLNDGIAPDTAVAVLGVLPNHRHTRGIPATPAPTDWDMQLEAVLGEVARRYSTALAAVVARQLLVVLDLDPLFTPGTPALAVDERDRVLERVDELLRIGRSAAVHVIAISEDPAARYRISSTTRGTTRTFLVTASEGDHR